MEFICRVKLLFRKKGWHFTQSVRYVLDVLCSEEKLLKAYEIKKKMPTTHQSINISTIYRVLHRLESLGLVHEFEGSWKRCTKPEDTESEHHFLICTNCNGVEEIFLDYRDSIAEQLWKKKHFVLTRVHLGFWGECQRCQS